MAIILGSPFAAFEQIQIYYEITIVYLFPKCRVWQDVSVHKHTRIIICLVGFGIKMYSNGCTHS